MSDLNTLATIIIGSIGTLGALLCLNQEEKYRKAKKVLSSAESNELMSPQSAITLVQSTKQKQDCYVSGNVKALDSSKLVYVETRPRYFSYDRLHLVDDISGRSISSSKFLLSHDNNTIALSPYQGTTSFGVKAKAQEYSGLMRYLRFGLILLTGGARLPFRLFDVDLSISEGDYITAFGTVSYNLRNGAVEMTKAKYLFKGSKRDLVNYLTNQMNNRWWLKISCEIITAGILGYFGYRVYKSVSAWAEDRAARQRARNENPRMIVVNNLSCVICGEEYRTVIYKDCGHLAVCSKCDQARNLTNCPICNKSIQDKSIVYLA